MCSAEKTKLRRVTKTGKNIINIPRRISTQSRRIVCYLTVVFPSRQGIRTNVARETKFKVHAPNHEESYHVKPGNRFFSRLHARHPRRPHLGCTASTVWMYINLYSSNRISSKLTSLPHHPTGNDNVRPKNVPSLWCRACRHPPGPRAVQYLTRS